MHVNLKNSLHESHRCLHLPCALTIIRSLATDLECKPLSTQNLLLEIIIADAFLSIVLLGEVTKNSARLPKRNSSVWVLDGFSQGSVRLLVSKAGEFQERHTRNTAVGIDVDEGWLLDVLKLDVLDFIRHAKLLKDNDDLERVSE